ncbi:MAG: F0F1 ATP synthase subunit A [Sandaracinaceae bacterium]
MGHETWFSLFLTPLYDLAVQVMSYMGRPFNEAGQTWGLLGDPHDLTSHDTAGHGPQALLHVALVVVPFLVILALVTYSQVRDKDKALVPEERLSLRTISEILVGATYGMMKDIFGKPKPARYFLPLIGTCAFFILFSNALGLIPGFLPPTSSLNVTLACALIIFVMTHVYGIREHGFVNYFRHFLGPREIQKLPWLPLLLLIFVVESISHLVRPMSLSVRLMANMFADHTVIGMFMDFPLPFVYPVPILLLGTLVVVVQTLVFCILSTVYIAMAIAHEEH